MAVSGNSAFAGAFLVTRKTVPSVQELWSLPFAVADIPGAGAHRDIEADAPARARIAAAAGLRDVSRLAAHFDLMPLSGDRVHVTGTVSAIVGQTCVVTLEPLDNPIEEGVDLIFSPAAGEADPEPEPDGDDPNRHGSWEADPPEPLVNGIIDLGALAAEFMVLGINPYPRKEGAVLPAPVEKTDPQSHPFAALARLKGEKGE
jgi:Large ribosomal RNA subunit accumulation protein YceD